MNQRMTRMNQKKDQDLAFLSTSGNKLKSSVPFLSAANCKLPDCQRARCAYVIEKVIFARLLPHSFRGCCRTHTQVGRLLRDESKLPDSLGTHWHRA